MLNDPPRSPAKPHRTWSGKGRRRRCQVETEYLGDRLTRGWIRPVGLDDTTDPTTASSIVWSVVSYDHEAIAHIAGDFVDAEKALLDATRELES